MGLKNIGVNTLTFQGHVTSSIIQSAIGLFLLVGNCYQDYLKPLSRYLHL